MNPIKAVKDFSGRDSSLFSSATVWVSPMESDKLMHGFVSTFSTASPGVSTAWSGAAELTRVEFPAAFSGTVWSTTVVGGV